jgi:PAS domain-containing protein
MKNKMESYYQTILNAIPLMIFVVDDDVRIHDMNDTATTVFGLDKTTVLKRRGGEVLHCLHAHCVSEGCGRALVCKDCVIRDSVLKCLRGQAVHRRRTKVELVSEGTVKEFELLITASPMPGNDEPLALLILEDISEISKLRAIIPICMKCKKIRNDEEYWTTVEEYFNENLGVDFSHGLCPPCFKELYPDSEDK